MSEILKNNEKRLRVGLFCDAFFPLADGVVMVVDNYARRLSKFCDVTVFTVEGRQECDKTFPYKVVRCGRLSLPFLDYDLPLPSLDSKFRKELGLAKLDIVHIHSPFSVGRIGVDYAKKHKIPVIATMHSQFKQDFYRATKNSSLTNFMLSKIMKVFNDCDEYYGVNPKISEIFKEYGAKHMPLVQRNGTDFMPIENESEAIKMVNEKFHLPEDMPVFLFVGRINALKNIYFILESLKKLKTKYFKMIFVGDGQDMDDFRIAVEESEVSDNVILTGKIMDRDLLRAIYLRAKLFLFPSMYDASSLVQIEAASQKTPTIFLKGSATSATVTDYVNGFLSEPTTDKFAEKIMEILEDDALYKKVSEGAFRDLYVSWDDCVSEIYEKYLYHIEKNKRKLAKPKRTSKNTSKKVLKRARNVKKFERIQTKENKDLVKKQKKIDSSIQKKKTSDKKSNSGKEYMSKKDIKKIS